MPEKAVASERLDSWKEIAAYLERNERTVVRWEKEKGLPVHRIPGGQRHAVFAYREELDEWLTGAGGTNGVEQAPANGNRRTGSSVFTAVMPVEIANPQQETISRKKQIIFSVAGIVTVLLLVISVYLYVNSHRSFHAPQLILQQQLTSNSQEKQGLLADGKTLYFGQEQDGWFALTAMPVDGGPIRVLWSPQANVLPVDISPDGRKLLALVSVGAERDGELWIVPLDSGEPRRLSNFVAHSATWAPDGKTIAYSAGNGIYLITESETTPRKIGLFTSLPNVLAWSQDGQRLRFILADNSTDKVISWGEISGDDRQTVTLCPLPPSMKAYGNWTRATEWNGYLISGHEKGRTPIWLLQYRNRWWEPVFQEVPLGFVAGGVHGITSSAESSRLFVVSNLQTRTSFMSFDPRTQAFRSILPGVSGMFLDFSRDGKWVAYTSYGEGPLWVSRADGSGVRQLTSGQERVELPQWSPDGRQIAFMIERKDRPWRIHILDLESGATREASEGDDSQGAPTWSPDGRFLTYGNVRCEHTHTCAIHRIDLATGKVQTLPDSEGLFTARWSPDGRFIAALHLYQHKLMLFDVKAGKWHTLANAIDGSDLSWSSNSKHLYANLYGTNARIIRIRVADGHQETVLDLHSHDKFDITENEDLQFSLAPDDSVILHRQIHFEEIYAYDLRER
jgi:Tol biopolymer transport system component